MIGNVKTPLPSRDGGLVLGVLQPVVTLDDQCEEQGRSVRGLLRDLYRFPGAVVCGHPVAQTPVAAAHPGKRDRLLLVVFSDPGDGEGAVQERQRGLVVTVQVVPGGDTTEEVGVVTVWWQLLVLGQEILRQALTSGEVLAAHDLRAVGQQAESVPRLRPVGEIAEGPFSQHAGLAGDPAEVERANGATYHVGFG